MARLAHSDVANGPGPHKHGRGRTVSNSALHASAQPPFRLLVVDDEVTMRELTSAKLTKLGYEVLTAQDGHEALELLPQFRPDLVITDLRMPRLSGFELVEIMRHRSPGLPVIIVTEEYCDEKFPPSIAFLQKSGNIAPLSAKIKDLLLLGPIASGPVVGEERNMSQGY